MYKIYFMIGLREDESSIKYFPTKESARVFVIDFLEKLTKLLPWQVAYKTDWDIQLDQFRKNRNSMIVECGGFYLMVDKT